jgi:hypothetical protein
VPGPTSSTLWPGSGESISRSLGRVTNGCGRSREKRRPYGQAEGFLRCRLRYARRLAAPTSKSPPTMRTVRSFFIHITSYASSGPRLHVLEGRGAPILCLFLIHPSAWKVNSAIFAVTEFYEVRHTYQRPFDRNNGPFGGCARRHRRRIVGSLHVRKPDTGDQIGSSRKGVWDGRTTECCSPSRWVGPTHAGRA